MSHANKYGFCILGINFTFSILSIIMKNQFTDSDYKLISYSLRYFLIDREKNIVTNGWSAEKPLKNHWSQWLSMYHSINGDGHLWKPLIYGDGSKFLHLCLASGDIKQINANSTIPSEEDVRFADNVEYLREMNFL